MLDYLKTLLDDIEAHAVIVARIERKKMLTGHLEQSEVDRLNDHERARAHARQKVADLLQLQAVQR